MSSGLEASQAKAEHLRFLQPGRVTHKALGRGRCAQPPPVGLHVSQKSKARLKNTLTGAFQQRKERESPKEPFMNFYQTLCCLLFGSYSTENSRAERLEIGAARET